MTSKTITTIVETAAGPDACTESWRVEATYGIENDGCRGYFSLTGRAWRRSLTRRADGTPDRTGGQIRSLIVAAFPHLALFAEMHLRDAVTGEPVHALENAWYWFTSADPHPDAAGIYVPAAWRHLDGAGRAASYLGCDPQLFDHIASMGRDDHPAKSEFARRVDLLRPGWEQLAQAVRGIYRLDDGTTSALSAQPLLVN